MGERVNKIRFVGSINKATRVRKSVTLSDFGNRKKENARVREEKESELRFLHNQVRVRLIIL